MNTPLVARLETVKRALRKWDPIGVIETLEESGLPPDEYDSYAPSVLSGVESGENGQDLAKRLASIRVDYMGLGDRRPSEREQEIGQKLSSWHSQGYREEPDFRSSRYAV
jgi:hypothetical protein